MKLDLMFINDFCIISIQTATFGSFKAGQESMQEYVNTKHTVKSSSRIKKLSSEYRFEGTETFKLYFWQLNKKDNPFKSVSCNQAVRLYGVNSRPFSKYI